MYASRETMYAFGGAIAVFGGADTATRVVKGFNKLESRTGAGIHHKKGFFCAQRS